MFLNPFLLFGLAAVSVPVIIHLLNRRKFEHVVWAAMRFIQQAVEQNQRRIQVEDLILLILRCLIIGLIVLALSKPALSAEAASGKLLWWVVGGVGFLITAGGSLLTTFLKPRAAGIIVAGLGIVAMVVALLMLTGKQAVAAARSDSASAVIVLDNSASMCQVDGPITHFEQAKQLADQVLNNLPRTASVSFVLVSDVADPVISEPTADHDAIRKAIIQAQLSDRGSNIMPGLTKAVEILSERRTMRNEIFVITDSQRLGWRQSGDIEELIKANKSKISTTVIFTGNMTTRNLAVTGLRVDSEIAAVNQPLRFSAQVTNYGVTAANDVEVSLRLDGDTVVSSSAHLPTLGSGESKSVLLTARVAKEGHHSVTVSVPHDEIRNDDSRSLAVRVVKQVKVLLVDGDPGREARDAKSFYLRHVLQPVDPAQRESFFIQSSIVSPMEMAGQPDVDVIVLANVTDLPASDLPMLERFVKNGGGLIIFPGAGANIPFYNEQLYRKRGLLPAALGEPRGDPTQSAKFWTFQSGEFTHPISEIWNQGDRGNPATVHFYRVYDLLNDKKKVESPTDVALGEPRVVMNYNDGKPAIMERSWGMGRVVLFSSGAESSWNDLPVRAKIYVPLMMRTLGSLLGREDELLNIRVGERLALQQPAKLIGTDVLITPPGDDKVAQQSTRIDLSNGVAMLKFDHTNRAGVYNVSMGEASLKFAAGANPEESAVEPMGQTQIDDLERAGVAVIQWRPAMQVDDALKRAQGYAGTEFWFLLATLGLVLATAETFLAHVFSRPK